eukprot:1414391-Pleurochrysis_carterae.AAC.1
MTPEKRAKYTEVFRVKLGLGEGGHAQRQQAAWLAHSAFGRIGEVYGFQLLTNNALSGCMVQGRCERVSRL